MLTSCGRGMVFPTSLQAHDAPSSPLGTPLHNPRHPVRQPLAIVAACISVPSWETERKLPFPDCSHPSTEHVHGGREDPWTPMASGPLLQCCCYCLYACLFLRILPNCCELSCWRSAVPRTWGTASLHVPSWLRRTLQAEGRPPVPAERVLDLLPGRQMRQQR